MTDKRKGWFLIGISLIGYLIVWVLIHNRLSLLYGIPTIPLIWGRILLTTEPSERRARRLQGYRDHSRCFVYRYHGDRNHYRDHLFYKVRKEENRVQQAGRGERE
jgi:hypothetical protein